MALGTSVVICCLIAIATLPILSNGFSPNYVFTAATFTTGSVDHQEMTESGALVVLKDYLLDNPNTVVDSTSVINSLQDPSARSLFGAYYHGTETCNQAQCDLIHRYYNGALESIKLANTDVDGAETGIPPAHFDNEAIPEGNNRIQVKRQIIIRNIQAGSYEKARTETGLALHTLQDFYSHSNWVELDNTEPLEDLGRPTYTPSNIASPSIPTCNNCERGQDVPQQLLAFTAGFAQFRHEYDCVDNIRSDIISNNVLISGYTGREKPEGKCSHAGLADLTATLEPFGGINKDLKTNVWSSHSDLHDQAANVATKATVLFLQDIREEVGDEAFGRFLNIDQPRLSVAFVIDTTGSTAHFTHIQAALPRIKDGLDGYQELVGGAFGIDYILVPISDPDQGAVQMTENFTVLAESIQRLTGTGVGVEDCMEQSIGAIVRAASYSRERGIINIFTDGQPSDMQRLPEALSIIKTKNLKLNIFSIAGCVAKRRRKRQTVSQLYEHLAFISGGQILKVPTTDLANIDSVVSSSVRLSVATIFQQAGTDSSVTVQFPVDSTVTDFFITVNGNDLQNVELRSPQGQDVLDQSFSQEHLSSSSTFLATINAPNATYYGTWKLSFNSSSTYRVFITADSRLTYSYTLYRLNEEVKGKAQPGETLSPLATVDNEVERAVITAGSFTNSAGGQLFLLPLILSDLETGNYVLAAGAPPAPFVLSVTGNDSRGFPFARLLGSGVDVSDVTIRLTIGQSPFQVLRSGENRTLCLVLSNQGGNATFTVQILSSSNSSGFTASFEEMATTQTVSVLSGGTTNLNLQISAQENIDEMNFLSLIITVYDQGLITRNNYFNIQVHGTSVPPVDLSQIEFYSASKKLGGGALSYVFLLISLLIGANFYSI